MIDDAACILRQDWVIYEEMMKQLANLPRSELKEAAFGTVCANKNLMQQKVIRLHYFTEKKQSKEIEGRNNKVGNAFS